MSTENTAAPTDFFERAHIGSLKRSVGNRLLNVVCVFLALLTFVPLISIILPPPEEGPPASQSRCLSPAAPGRGHDRRRLRQCRGRHAHHGRHRPRARRSARCAGIHLRERIRPDIAPRAWCALRCQTPHRHPVDHLRRVRLCGHRARHKGLLRLGGRLRSRDPYSPHYHSHLRAGAPRRAESLFARPPTVSVRQISRPFGASCFRTPFPRS